MAFLASHFKAVEVGIDTNVDADIAQIYADGIELESNLVTPVVDAAISDLVANVVRRLEEHEILLLTVSACICQRR